MSAPLIIGGIAVAAGAALVLRARQKAAAPGAGLCAGTLQPLGQALGFYIPPQTCGAIDVFAGKLTNFRNYDAKDAKNRELNGEIEIPLGPEVKSMSTVLELALGAQTPSGLDSPSQAITQGKFVEPMKGSVLRFKSGCEPFTGAPGFAKCAKGTQDMRVNGDQFLLVTPGVVPKSVADLKENYAKLVRGKAIMGDLMTGRPGDAATSHHRFEAGYFIGGRLVKCQPGNVLKPEDIQVVTDHRTGATSIRATCSDPNGPALSTPPPVAGSGTQTAYSSAPSAPPPGYRWGEECKCWQRI